MENNDLQEKETLALDEEINEQDPEEEVIEEDEPDYDTLKEKLTKAEQKLKEEAAMKLRYKNKLQRREEEKKQPNSSEESNKEDVSLSERDEIYDLRLDGYSKDEVNFIMRNGGRAALKDPFVSNSIKSMREQAKAESATPKDNGYGSGAFKKMTEDQIKNLSSKEIEEKLAGK